MAFSLRVVTEFTAEHLLRGYPGSCAVPHAHDFRVEVEITAHTLGPIGMTVDFREIRRVTETLAEPLRGQSLHELDLFARDNPTAENLATYFFRGLSQALPGLPGGGSARLRAVTVWENGRSAATYSEP